MHTQIYIHIHSQSQGRTAHQSTWFNCILKCLCVCVCSFKLILPKTNQIYSHLNNCREAARRRKLLSKYHINLCSTHFIFSSSHNHSKSIILKLFRSRSIFRGISSLECAVQVEFTLRTQISCDDSSLVKQQHCCIYDLWNWESENFQCKWKMGMRRRKEDIQCSAVNFAEVFSLVKCWNSSTNSKYFSQFQQFDREEML